MFISSRRVSSTLFILLSCLIQFGCFAQQQTGPELKDQRFLDPLQKPFHTIQQNNGCWRPVIPSDVFFDFDKQDLKPEGRVILDKVGGMLQKYPFLKLHIKGHTDNIGSMEYNTRLSRKRVEAGLNYIVGQGIQEKRIFSSWHSFSLPKTSNETKKGRAINRRMFVGIDLEVGPNNPGDRGNSASRRSRVGHPGLHH